MRKQKRHAAEADIFGSSNNYDYMDCIFYPLFSWYTDMSISEHPEDFCESDSLCDVFYFDNDLLDDEDDITYDSSIGLKDYESKL